MFSVNTKEEDGFEIVVLKDELANTNVKIIPACGAILHAFNINYGKDTLNIIDHYNSRKEFEEQVETKGFKGCKLSPFVCRLKEGKYEFGDKEYIIEKFYLGNHALHGIIYDASFDIVKLDAGAESASVELLFAYNGKDKGFPFKYDCRIIYELQKNNSLEITTVIKNHESFAIPVADGWHPYFSFGGPINDLQLSFKCEHMLEFDEELIPTNKKLPYPAFKTLTQIGDTVFDNGFLVDFNDTIPVVILRDEEKELQLEIQPDPSYPFLQIYTPGHRQSIAIENLSAAPDAFNNENGLTILPAGNEAIYKTNFRISNSQ